MWGSTDFNEKLLWVILIFPTDVGINRCECVVYRILVYIPHGCGDQPGEFMARNYENKYSPRMWGSTARKESSAPFRCIFLTGVGINIFTLKYFIIGHLILEYDCITSVNRLLID